MDDAGKKTCPHCQTPMEKRDDGVFVCPAAMCPFIRQFLIHYTDPPTARAEV